MARTPPLTWPRLRRRRVSWEIAIVLGLSLGMSAVYSVVSIIAIATDDTSLADQTAALNQTEDPREWLDFTYHWLGIFFALVPVALVFYLLAISGGNPFRRIGFTLTEPVRDVARGLLLVLVIGLPGIALYFIGRAVGITLNLDLAPEQSYWWTVPFLVGSALRAALTEELIVVGYLFTRLRQLGWGRWQIILSAAVLRGSYHLYQGIGPFIGNVVMGIVFGWCYQRWGRTMPLVVAHWIIDIASFVGYSWALATFPDLFRIPPTPTPTPTPTP
jgi:membrane protease YdiL (CAAX protease family)